MLHPLSPVEIVIVSAFLAATGSVVPLLVVGRYRAAEINWALADLGFLAFYGLVLTLRWGWPLGPFSPWVTIPIATFWIGYAFDWRSNGMSVARNCTKLGLGVFGFGFLIVRLVG